MDTRRYAKRQVTWFRNQMPGWIWASPEEGEAVIQASLRNMNRAAIGEPPMSIGRSQR